MPEQYKKHIQLHNKKYCTDFSLAKCEKSQYFNINHSKKHFKIRY